MSIVFGSPEARAILERDRAALAAADDETPQGTTTELQDRLDRINADIESLEDELAGLEDEAEQIRAQLAKAETVERKIGWTQLNKWNSWAKGQAV